MSEEAKLPAAVPDTVEATQLYRMSTNAASMCRDIVATTARSIQGRKYVQVEGWQAIALAHGCAVSAGDVQEVEGGVRAIGYVRRMRDGLVIATAEGFVGKDEPVWYGGRDARGKVHPRRLDYAIRAMAQTRAMSRVCRAAFAHVVVMMNAGLETTPAEEVPDEGPRDATPPPRQTVEHRAGPATATAPADAPPASVSGYEPLDPDAVETLAKVAVILDELGGEFWRGDISEASGKLGELYQQCQSQAMLEAAASNNVHVTAALPPSAVQYVRGVYREQLSKVRKR